MRAFFVPSLSIILLSLIGIEDIFAASLEDAFGLTNYAIECSGRIYKKHEIYAAAKKLCDERKDYKNIDFLSPWLHSSLCFPRTKYIPFSYTPIFKEDLLHSDDSSSEERIVEDADGYEVKILPGNDRLVIDTKCDIVGAFIDHGHIFDRDTRYERCSVLRYPGDFSASFEAPGLSCYDPSSGAPQASHQSPQRSASPPGSPKQTLQRSQQQPVSIPHPESSEQHHERSRSRSRLRQKLRQDSASNYPTESPERHFQQSSKLSPTRSPEREAKFLSDQPVDESRRLSDKLPDWIKVVPPPKPLNIDIFNFKESNKNVK